MLDATAFELLRELEQNNNREWFQENKARFSAHVQEPFADVLNAVSEALSSADLPLSGGSHTMFRINRDVRFSKDKSPYNTHVSGVLTPSGTKSEAEGVLYLHLNSQGGFMASGYYKMKPADLGPIRDKIVEAPERLREVVTGLEDAGCALSKELTLKSMPQGYAEHATSWYAEYLRLQAFMVKLELQPDIWTSGKIVELAADLGRASEPLIRFGRA
jgi:uncharacterized protein (TIGR02453 family)